MADVLGDTGNNNLIGDINNDYMRGLAGLDTLAGGDGADTIFAGRGGDSVLGDAGADVILGQQGSDTIDGGLGDDLIAGGLYDGESIPGGEADDDLIFGAQGNDTITGQAGNDVIYGGDGNDLLSGNENNDILYDGAGNDTMAGGTGNDAIFYRNAENIGATNLADGGEGFDRIHLSVTTAEWAHRPFQNDIATILRRIGANDKTPYTLTSTGLTIANFEQLTVDVAGMELDPVNEEVIPENDTLRLNEDQDPVSINLLTNDYVPDRALVVEMLTQSAYGTVEIVSDLLALSQTAIATFTTGPKAQTLQQGEIVQEVLTYRVMDVDDSEGTAHLIITIEGINDVPVVTGLRVGRITDGVIPPIVGRLNIADVDHDESFFRVPPSLTGTYGNFTFNHLTGDWTYTLDQASIPLKTLSLDEIGTETLTVTSFDGTQTDTITITVVGINDLPTLKAGVMTSIEDGDPVTLDMTTLGDDIDSDNSPTDLTYTVDVAPPEGATKMIGTTLEFDPGTDYQYRAEGEKFTETFQMKVTDRHGATATNSVTVEMVGVNDLTVIMGATAPAYTMYQLNNGLRGYSVSGRFTYRDVDLLDNHTADFADRAGMQGATGMFVTVVPPAVRGGIGTVYWRFDALEGSPILGTSRQITINITDTPGAVVQHTVSLQIPDITPDPVGPDQEYGDPIVLNMVARQGLTPIAVPDYMDIPPGSTVIASRDPSETDPGLKFHSDLPDQDGATGPDSEYLFIDADSGAFQYLASSQTNTFTYDYVLTIDDEPYLGKIELTMAGSRKGIFGTDTAENLLGTFEDEVFHSGSGSDTLTSGGTEDNDVFAYMMPGTGEDLIAGASSGTNFVTGGGNTGTPMTGVDVIMDFVRGFDHIGVSASGFGGGLVAGSETFNLVNVEDRASYSFGGAGGVLIFDQASGGGTLYWDADGGYGGNAIALARLVNVNELDNQDFFIFV